MPLATLLFLLLLLAAAGAAPVRRVSAPRVPSRAAVPAPGRCWQRDVPGLRVGSGCCCLPPCPVLLWGAGDPLGEGPG